MDHESARTNRPPVRERRPRFAALLAVAVAAPLLLAGGCQPAGEGGAGEADTVAADTAAPTLGAEAQAALDSGNAAYREQSYEEALEHYRRAGELAPDHGAPLFGIRMAAQAMGDSALADSALGRLQEITPGAESFHRMPPDTSERED